MKYLIIATTVVASTALFSMKTTQDNSDKYFVIIKNSLPTNNLNMPKPHIKLFKDVERIGEGNSKDRIIADHPEITSISLQPNNTIKISLDPQKTSANFALVFHTPLQNGQAQPLKLNANVGPFKFEDNIDIRLMSYYKDEEAIGLFCNDECVTFFPLKTEK